AAWLPRRECVAIGRGRDPIFEDVHNVALNLPAPEQKAHVSNLLLGDGLVTRISHDQFRDFTGMRRSTTRDERWTRVEYVRFADDLVVLVDAPPRQRWLRTAVERRLREELATLQVEVNEEKSRRVDLTQGECFGFLGFDFRRIRSRRDRWMPLRTPRGKKRTALLRTLKQVFR